VTISNLSLNGNDGDAPNQASPQVNGNYVTFDNVEITNDNTGICVMIGGAAQTYGIPWHTSIVHSRIHDCGRLPPTRYEHGIYLAYSRGARILGNYIYDNADWGIHLYPNAIGSRISNNIIDGNGSGLIIAGAGDTASSQNYIGHNVFSNSRYGYNLTSFWGTVVGSDNAVKDNCVWNGAIGEVNGTNGGFTVSRIRRADPEYVSRETKDFRLRHGSPCAGYGPRTR
jgi:parallel beta-helix repeat protein